MTHETEPPLENTIKIVHAIPGRVRVRVTGSDAESAIETLAQELRQILGVGEVRTNLTAGSLLVNFDDDRLSLSQMLEYIQQYGISLGVTSLDAQQTDALVVWKSGAFWQEQLASIIPIVVGLLVTRGLAIQGWRAILIYMLTASTTRQAIAYGKTAGSILLSESSQSSSELNGRATIQETNTPILDVEPLPLVALKIAHSIPGRIRFQVPRIAEDPQYAERLADLAKSWVGVTSVRVNSMAGSITIVYKSGMEISDLINLIQSADTDHKTEELTDNRQKLAV